MRTGQTRAGHQRTSDADTAPSSSANLSFATRFVRQVCRLSGDITLLDATPHTRRLRRAIVAHDTPWLFDWLITSFSYQGISDSVAASFIAAHGNASWSELMTLLAMQPSCPKLKGYWHFSDCGYVKSQNACNSPKHFKRCPLPSLPLRNGRLNQTAFSLFLFIRDVCDGDIVRWIDRKVGREEPPARASREALLDPMRDIFGVSDKVLSMTLAALLLAAPKGRKPWTEVGASMIAVDTLVHNFLHRTGILASCGADHAYGTRCYGEEGCVGVLNRIAAEIDASEFNASYPQTFPRFVQHAIWRYCAQEGLNLCNGNQIDDDLECDNIGCYLLSKCRRIPLNFNAIL